MTTSWRERHLGLISAQSNIWIAKQIQAGIHSASHEIMSLVMLGSLAATLGYYSHTVCQGLAVYIIVVAPSFRKLRSRSRDRSPGPSVQIEDKPHQQPDSWQRGESTAVIIKKLFFERNPY